MAVCLVHSGLGADLKTVELAKPRTDGGRPFMQVLRDRRSTRSFSDKPLPPQVLSDLLWAAFGVNRPESGKRTAPSAVNWQEIDIYVALPDGVYLYQASTHTLQQVLGEDIRAMTGVQSFVARAPVVLIFVADRGRMGRAKDEDKDFYSAVDTGYISQNVYLFAASEGLATVVLGMVNRAALAQKLGLREDQKIILTQPVGYPAE
ncbi:MAG: SagB/ThcOx family dehydrogenase [Kiritimatiellae bacterium]|nr:SagB/ThcOx family dehydrogenase [Kiritimatiellia bacterium]